MDSMRFNPYWNENSGNQITGFIHMLCTIRSINPRKQNYVEIGTYNAESTLLAASFDFIEDIFCIDPFNIIENFTISKKRLSHIDKNIKYIQKRSQDAYSLFEDSSIDILYIDGDHSYESVKNDLKNWHPKVKFGGFICGHDYNATSHPAVIQAVDEFVELNNLQIDRVFCDTSFLIVNN